MSRALVYHIYDFTGCFRLHSDQEGKSMRSHLPGYLTLTSTLLILEDAIPEGTPEKDSLVLAKRYIDTWVRDQLMLSRAEQALTEEQKDFEKQIAEYHRSC